MVIGAEPDLYLGYGPAQFYGDISGTLAADRKAEVYQARAGQIVHGDEPVSLC